MNAVGSEFSLPAKQEGPPPGSWSRLRWMVGIGLVFAAHIGLIYGFGRHKPVTPRPVSQPPTLEFAPRASELEILDDPTIFALPHPLGFAAASWLQAPHIQFSPFRWSEPAQLLTLNLEGLGAAFLSYTLTNKVPNLTFESLPRPQWSRPADAEPATTLKHRSTVKTGGGLADRRWLNAPAILPSWPAADFLTNSVVRVLPDADGEVFSPVLLPPGSGSTTADQMALEIARDARFAPATPEAGRPVIGTLIFEWHTVPLPDTNAPAPKP